MPEARTFRRNGHIILKGRPCKVLRASISRPDRYPDDICHIIAVDIFNGNRIEVTVSSTADFEAPTVRYKDYHLMNITDAGFVSLADENGNTKDGLKLPTHDDSLSKKIKEGFEAGNDMTLSVISSMGEDGIHKIEYEGLIAATVEEVGRLTMAESTLVTMWQDRESHLKDFVGVVCCFFLSSVVVILPSGYYTSYKLGQKGSSPTAVGIHSYGLSLAEQLILVHGIMVIHILLLGGISWMCQKRIEALLKKSNELQDLKIRKIKELKSDVDVDLEGGKLSTMKIKDLDDRWSYLDSVMKEFDNEKDEYFEMKVLAVLWGAAAVLIVVLIYILGVMIAMGARK